MLIAFLVSWLLTQYHAAGKRIEKDVRADLRKTSEQMVDSLMIQFFTVTNGQPQSTTTNIAITHPEIPTSIAQSSTEIKIIVKDDSIDQHALTHGLMHKIPASNIKHIQPLPLNGHHVVMANSEKEFLEDSVLKQLFTEGAGAMAKQLSDFDKTSNILSITNQQLDTALGRKLQRKNWQNNDLKYALVFRDKSKDSSLIYSRNPLSNRHRVVMANSEKDLLEDSVLTQLFTEGAGAMAKQLSTYQKTSNILSITNQQLDTALCRKLLRKNWQNKDLKYALVFRNKSKDSSLIYSGNPLFGSLFGVRLENKQQMAFSAILPEFSFAFLLLIITIVAFVLVYRSYLKQVQINLLRTDFVNNISHELKTPVSTVRVALDALQQYDRKNDPQVRDEYLHMMSLEVDRLDRLIHQVLQHGRLESTKSLLQLAPVDVGALTEAVVEHYRFKSAGKGATILLKKPPHTITLMLDEEHFKGVLGNLIENALVYAGDAPEIVVTLQQNDRHTLLEVQDNGPGIDPHYHAQLFQPFFRVPKGNTHNVKGYGLGLSYCKQIVEQHNGTLSVRNLTTGGCAFLITLNR